MVYISHLLFARHCVPISFVPPLHENNRSEITNGLSRQIQWSSLSLSHSTTWRDCPIFLEIFLLDSKTPLFPAFLTHFGCSFSISCSGSSSSNLPISAPFFSLLILHTSQVIAFHTRSEDSNYFSSPVHSSELQLIHQTAYLTSQASQKLTHPKSLLIFIPQTYWLDNKYSQDSTYNSKAKGKSLRNKCKKYTLSTWRKQPHTSGEWKTE